MGPILTLTLYQITNCSLSRLPRSVAQLTQTEDRQLCALDQRVRQVLLCGGPTIRARVLPALVAVEPYEHPFATVTLALHAFFLPASQVAAALAHPASLKRDSEFEASGGSPRTPPPSAGIMSEMVRIL